ncbi:hypothetical protein PPYR_13432 [Photinus pyralis]|uniref:Uncharacterized protein n=1 Tax=Photinus pyralis TaxID=7054 RepID=A0A1Y1KU36_PHOPY|nr:uncharacterized protein LOC116178617 [Photinus pyralis]KAB0793812.1 hypothetical protein PPYR_13432 [Photinus pyralis]
MFRKAVLCLYIACLVLVKTIEIPDALIDEVAAACMKEKNFDKAKLSEMFDDEFHMKYPHDVTSKFMDCALGKVDFFQEDGAFNREVLTKDLAKALPNFLSDKIDDKKAAELANEIYHDCSVPKGESAVEKVANFHNCMIVELKKKATAV